MKKLLRALSEDDPDLLVELMPSLRQQKTWRRLNLSERFGGVLNCRGPLLNAAMQRFAARAGFALHCELTKQPVPHSGGAYVRWYTNYDALSGNLPQNLIALLGEPKTLKQGHWEVPKQFMYASKGSEDGSLSAHFITFRFSFAAVAFVTCDVGAHLQMEELDKTAFYAPGFLRQKNSAHSH